MSTPVSVLFVAACSMHVPQGSQIHIRQIYDSITAAGLHARLLSYDAIAGNHRFFRLPANAGPSIRKLFLDLSLRKLLLRQIATQKPSIIHCHNIEACLLAASACRKFSIPLVYSVHGIMRDELPLFFPKTFSSIFNYIGARLDTAAARSADVILSLDKSSLAYWQARRSSSALFVPPSINLKEIDQQPEKALPLLPSDLPRIGYIGNIDRYQNLSLAINAFRLLKRKYASLNLTIAYHNESHRRSVVNLHGPGIHLLQIGSFAEAKYLLQKLDILLLPRVLHGGFPIKLMNYMAMAKPIVTTRQIGQSCGFPEECMLSAEATPEAFALAIGELIENPALRLQLGQCARRIVAEQFNSAYSAKRILTIYSELLDRDHEHSHIRRTH
mgnify:CR=1 FL=1